MDRPASFAVGVLGRIGHEFRHKQGQTDGAVRRHVGRGRCLEADDAGRYHLRQIAAHLRQVACQLDPSDIGAAIESVVRA